MFTDAVEELFFGALRPLIDEGIPVSQPPGDAAARTWVTFNEVSGYGRAASNGCVRVGHMVQLHAFSRDEGGAHRVAFFRAVALLSQAGVRVWSWGPDQYEQDTGVRHISCTCEWWQR